MRFIELGGNYSPQNKGIGSTCQETARAYPDHTFKLSCWPTTLGVIHSFGLTGWPAPDGR